MIDLISSVKMLAFSSIIALILLIDNEMAADQLFILEMAKIASTSLISIASAFFVYKAVGKKVDALHQEVNSKMTQLIDAEKAVSKQEGKDEATLQAD